MTANINVSSLDLSAGFSIESTSANFFPVSSSQVVVAQTTFLFFVCGGFFFEGGGLGGRCGCV